MGSKKERQGGLFRLIAFREIGELGEGTRQANSASFHTGGHLSNESS